MCSTTHTAQGTRTAWSTRRSSGRRLGCARSGSASACSARPPSPKGDLRLQQQRRAPRRPDSQRRRRPHGHPARDRLPAAQRVRGADRGALRRARDPDQRPRRALPERRTPDRPATTHPLVGARGRVTSGSSATRSPPTSASAPAVASTALRSSRTATTLAPTASSASASSSAPSLSRSGWTSPTR